MIAYELLEKLLSARYENNLCQREKLGQRHPVGHCLGQPDIVWSDRTLSGWGLGQIREKINYLGLKPNFADII
jgi:hypothetical protein